MARPPKTKQQRLMLKRLGHNVRTARLSAGVSQIALSEAIGAAHADYVRGIESGATDASSTRLVQIAVALGVDVSVLTDGMAEVSGVEQAQPMDEREHEAL